MNPSSECSFLILKPPLLTNWQLAPYIHSSSSPLPIDMQVMPYEAFALWSNSTPALAGGPLRLQPDELVTERDQYDHLAIALFKTVMMMFGEYAHAHTLIYPLFVHQDVPIVACVLTFVVYLAFLLFVPVVLMNLLVSKILSITL